MADLPFWDDEPEAFEVSDAMDDEKSSKTDQRWRKEEDDKKNSRKNQSKAQQKFFSDTLSQLLYWS